MPAYFDTGFCVRQPSWHGQETLLQDYPETWDDARRFAGLEWEPTYQDLYVPELVPFSMLVCGYCSASLGQPHLGSCDHAPGGAYPEIATEAVMLGQTDAFDGPNEGRDAGAIEVARDDFGVTFHMPVDGHQAIIRSDNRQVLAVPRDSWKLITHDQMGDLLEAYTEAWRKAGAKVLFETAGSVREGAMVWALVRLDEPYTVAGDDSETYPFAALLNAHDGSAACRLTPTQVRVVCWNTWKAAEYESESKDLGIVIRHSGNIEERIEDAKMSLSTMRDEAKAWQMVAGDLAGININDAVVRSFLDEFIPIPENAGERTRNQRAERQSTFMRLWEDSPTVAPLPDSAYKLVQAAGEYLDHIRPYRSGDTYLARTMLRPEPIKSGVITLVRDLARELV